MTTIPTPMSPYDIVGREEVSEPKEINPMKGDNETKKNRQTTQTNGPTKGDPAAKKQDSGKRYIADPPSPSDLPGCLTPWSPRSKRRYIWDRVTRIFVRSDSPGPV